MTNTEKQLIMSFALEEITKEDFLKRFPVDLMKENNYILSELLRAFDAKDEDLIEYAIKILHLDDFTRSDKYVDVFNKLLLVDWHERHEDIAALLKGIKSPKSVYALYKAATVQYDYLDYDDTYQFARKCIKALSAINDEGAIARLRDLSQYHIPEIAAYAQKELKYKGLV
jgi:hypothetical protein